MKKMSSLLLVFFAGTTLGHTQQHEPVNPQKDRMEFQGYSIHLMPAMRGTYGYYIVKGNQAVLYQSRNPFTGSPFGLSKKEDVYKVAKWQIQNLPSRPLPPPAPHLQKQLLATEVQKRTLGYEKRPFVRQQSTGQFPDKPRSFLPQVVPLKVAEELHINLATY